jgi:dephospho-CoA kinase
MILSTWSQKFVLGLTGIMGSGKSTVAGMFETLGALRIDSDKLAKFYTSASSPIIHELVSILGRDILDINGVPDRKRIASIVFSDSHKLEAMVSIIHPLVRKDAQDKIASVQDARVIAWEVPLLFESGAYTECDSTLTVVAEEEVCLKRARERDGISASHFYKRLAKQLSLHEKIKLSDFVIDNSTDESALFLQVNSVYEKILSYQSK